MVTNGKRNGNRRPRGETTGKVMRPVRTMTQPSYVARARNAMHGQQVLAKILVQVSLEITQGDRFKGVFNVNPYQLLANSTWAPYLKIWQRYRINRIDAEAFFPVMNTAYNPGSLATMYYRDGVVQSAAALREYEQLLVEPGVQHTRLSVKHNWHWLPVEPNDRNWWQTEREGQDMPPAAFGSICCAGLFDDMTNRPEADFALYTLLTMRVDFAGLIAPKSEPYKPDSTDFEIIN